MQQLIVFVGGIVIGAVLTALITTVLDDAHEKKAYLVFAGSVLDANGLDAYRELASPGATRAGIKFLGRNDDITSEHVLEGDWPYPGFLAIEEFSSMAALLDFWHSDDYQAAIKLREGKLELDFAVAVPGV